MPQYVHAFKPTPVHRHRHQDEWAELNHGALLILHLTPPAAEPTTGGPEPRHTKHQPRIRS